MLLQFTNVSHYFRCHCVDNEVNSCCAEFISGNIKTYICIFYHFSKCEMAKIVEILPCGKETPLYLAQSTSRLLMSWQLKEPVGWFKIKVSFYQYRKFNCGGKTMLQLPNLHNVISCTGKMTSLYWIRALGIRSNFPWILRFQHHRG